MIESILTSAVLTFDNNEDVLLTNLFQILHSFVLELIHCSVLEIFIVSSIVRFY